MWHDGDGMGWWMLWGGLMMILFWGTIIALVVWGIQAISRRDTDRSQGSQPGPPSQTPLDIAKERYARGDITRQEFEQIKRDLEGT